ncbi:pyruvate, water dikinase regulatory protein [Zavarzinia sp. CC-PAN008]|uniref:pyruvate, water dikinase regulatory protein n=1 Tax=Zavarzinia sp. CC-PAN008 TaxID=3243332 RepID=UPI003F74518D
MAGFDLDGQVTVRHFHLYLISDATGETLNAMSKAAVSQFEGVEVVERLYPLVRTRKQLERILADITQAPGAVMFTLVNHELRDLLTETCLRLNVPCIPVLDPIIGALGSFFDAKARNQPGRQHALDAGYFRRIEAMNFTMAHDDGQSTHDLSAADVVLVGISRTSKTPTCIYLANRGIKAANVALVPGVPLPAGLDAIAPGGTLVVGLTTSPDRLVQIRRNRLLALNAQTETDYVDLEAVKREVADARRLFLRRGWPVIDVTRRSIEETAAAILSLHDRRTGTEASPPPPLLA